MSEKLETKMILEHDKLLYWDQDVLNSVIDDRFEELNPYLNFNMNLAPDNNNISLNTKEEQEIIFLHYTAALNHGL